MVIGEWGDGGGVSCDEDGDVVIEWWWCELW